jgi:ketosteroid isomerase-like protein
MAEPDVIATIRQAYARYNAGDLDAVVSVLSEDVVFVPPPNSPEPEPLHGRDAVHEYLAPNLFDEQSAEPVEIHERRDRALVVAHARARGRGSGAEIDQMVFHLFHFDGEHAVKFEVFTDREQALAALGA